MKTKNNQDSAADMVWRFFASVRLSVVLLLTLAVTSVIGTLIPQNADPAAYERKFGQPLYSIFDALNLFDMYHSWWFRLLLCLLIFNILVCSIQRIKSTWKIIFPKNPGYQPDRFRKSPARAEWKSTGTSAQELEKIYESFIRKRFRNVRTEKKEPEGGSLIFGEKGRWTRLGVYAVHFSVLLLMTGALIGSIFGFEGYMNVPEGESRQQFSLKNKNQTAKLDFAIRCNDFTVSHYSSGRPKEYRSDIAIIENDKVTAEHKLRVNDPLTYKGITIFQSSYGKTPKNKFTVVFTDNKDGTRFEKNAAMGKSIEMPEESGKMIIEDYSNNFSFRGHNVGPSFIARLMPQSGKTRLVLLPVDHPRFDKMREGKYRISVKDLEFRHYTGLQITRDPGVPVVYAGFLIMIIGCYITFFMFHRKICVELEPESNATLVSVAGISARNRMANKNAVKRLAKRLEKITPEAGQKA